MNKLYADKAKSTNINAIKAWNKVIIITPLPNFFMLANLNSLPIEKAMKPKAISTMIPN